MKKRDSLILHYILQFPNWLLGQLAAFMPTIEGSRILRQLTLHSTANHLPSKVLRPLLQLMLCPHCGYTLVRNVGIILAKGACKITKHYILVSGCKCASTYPTTVCYSAVYKTEHLIHHLYNFSVKNETVVILMKVVCVNILTFKLGSADCNHTSHLVAY